MHLADCAMAVSGSVSLELLYHTTPTVILYHVSRFGYQVQKFFRKVKYITLVNLLSTGKLYTGDIKPYDPAQPDADKVLFPEYLTCEDKSAELLRGVPGMLNIGRGLDRFGGSVHDPATTVVTPAVVSAANPVGLNNAVLQ
jgi:lipid-A-disaccharide synthase